MHRQQGFSYVIALFLVATVALLSVRGLENLSTKEQRTREAELLFVGIAYRDAITQYYNNTPGSVKRFPPNLEALLQDARKTRMNRPLRRLYLDPITVSNDWGTITAPDGGVMGVFSKSQRQPMKEDGFPEDLAHFAKAKSYQDWQFLALPIQDSQAESSPK